MNKNYIKRILVTGGAGFIGSHVVRHFVEKYPDYQIVNFDALTYAGNLENLKDVEDKENYVFVHGDITDFDAVMKVFNEYEISDVIHLAAESHVDRSIKNPDVFAKTNVMGTLNLLNAAREKWCGFPYDLDPHRFHHVSTDEVYGSLDMNPENKFKETTAYQPHSPYSASKAASDHFVKAYHDTFGLNVTISNCSNNYGPNQFPEKLIPLVINKLEKGEKIPVYGTGSNVRDWLYVEDHAKAIDVIFHKGISGETYNIGGKCEKTNLEIIQAILNGFWLTMHKKVGDAIPNLSEVIEFVKDRSGHDLRYAIDTTKIETELDWHPEESFETGILKTLYWYFYNKEWVEHVTSGEYQNWMNINYENR
jgi:dTDP-glucose 4,6-dehydratase